MAGLTHKDVMHYVSLCRPIMFEALDCLSGDDLPHDCIFDMVQEITFIVHTGKRDQMTRTDRQFIQTGARAFSVVSKLTNSVISTHAVDHTKTHLETRFLHCTTQTQDKGWKLPRTL